MVSLTVDPSRLIETEYDKGIDLSITIIIDREMLIEPLVKFEVFPNINYYKMAIGGFYVVEVGKLEFAGGLEIGLIHRKKPNLNSYGSWFSYGINFETRLFIFEKFPFIATYNIQRRTDFQMYGTQIKQIGSLYIGFGFLF